MHPPNKNKFNDSNIIVASCFSIQAIGIGIYASYGVFFNPLMLEFGWSRAQISGASSAAFFISGLFAIYIGRLIDTIGPGIIMMATAIFLGLGCMLMYGLNTIWQLYLFFGLIFGIGLSSIDVVALSTIARWFPDQRGFMTGIAKVGTGAGQLFFPLLAGWLITGFGWRNAYMAIGILSLVLLSIIAQLLKRDPKGHENKKKSNKPKTTVHQTRTDLSFSQAATTVQFWVLCLITLTVLSCLMSIIVHIVPYGRDIGVSASKATGVLATIGGVSMAGRFITGIIIDRIGSRRSMAFSFLILLTGLLWLQFADSLWELYVFACIYGVAHGGFFTIVSPIVAELFGIASHGALFGMVVFFGTTGGAIGPIVTGYLFDISGSYNFPFGLMLLVSAVGFGLLFLLNPIKIDGFDSQQQ